MTKYDYLIVGSGLFGSTFAHLAHAKGRRVLVVEKRDHIGGNLYCESREGVIVHRYGAHIFHTSNREVWDYVNSLVEFNRFTNSPVAICGGELYNLPFNMNTFHALWGVKTPAEAMSKIEEQRSVMAGRTPKNLEEQAISLVGEDIYKRLIKGYTEKQWGRDCTDLPPFIINRLPVRLTYDNNYFADRYQGIPIGGYNKLIERMLDGIEVRLNVDFLDDREQLEQLADKVVYTGMIDQYFDFCYGKLEYRTLRFEHDVVDTPNYQGCAVVNYTDREIPYTRIIEHRHFDEESTRGERSVITREYPSEWSEGAEPYYPINDERNQQLYQRYSDLARSNDKIIFGGRLGLYRYFDMHHIIEQVLTIKDDI